MRTAGTLHWDVLGLYAGVLDGLRAAGRDAGRLDGIGIDSWAVDYGLLDADGALLGNPVHYRDARHATAVRRGARRRRARGAVPDQRAAVPAVQHRVPAGRRPRDTRSWSRGRTLLLIPDLLAYWLTGAVGAEVTNASTTGLLDATTREWSRALIDRPRAARGACSRRCAQPGDRLGELRDDVLAETGLTGPVPVTAVGSHDTASAVVGVPRRAGAVRLHLVRHVVAGRRGARRSRCSPRRAGRPGFTNELGVDGTVRYLRNVMGLWLLQECQRTWARRRPAADLAELLAAAAQVPAFTAVVDADDPRFLPPGDMPARIAEACAATGQTPPQSQAETVRCILDSLALAYRRTVRRAAELSGRDVEVVHLVGGGARNTLLCQLTADACGLPVLAGPVEAAALGNALVQARGRRCAVRRVARAPGSAAQHAGGALPAPCPGAGPREDRRLRRAAPR